MKGRYDALKYAKSMEKQLSIDPRKKKVQDALAQLHKRVAAEEAKGADVAKLSGVLSEASKAAEKNDLPRAEELIAAVEEGLGGLPPATPEDEVSRARERVNEVELLGLDVARAIEQIAQAEQALKARDLKAALKLARGAQKEAEKALEGSVEEAVPYAESLVAECERVGMDVAGLRAKMDTVKELVRKKEFNSSLQLSTELIDAIDPARRSYFRDFLSRAVAAVGESGQAGLDTSKMETSLQKARALIDAKDYESAAELLKGIVSEAKAGKGLVSEEEGALLLEELVHRVEGAGMEAEDLRREFNRILELRGAKDPSAAGAALEFRNNLEGVLKSAQECAALVEQARAAVSAGAKMGMDIKQFGARADELEGQLRARQFKDVGAGARRLLDRVRARQRELSSGAISSLQDEVDRFRKGGAPVEGPEGVLGRARAAVEAGRFEEAFSLARKTVDELDALRDALARYNQALSKCTGLLSDAAEQKMDCSMAEPIVQEAREAAAKGAFIEAAQTVERALELLSGAMLGRSSEGIQYAIGLISKADEEGTELEDIERAAIEGLGHAEDGDFKRAGEAAVAIEKLVGAQGRAHIMAADALQKAQETLAEAIIEGLAVSMETRKLELAEEACGRGEYESARYAAEDIAPALRQSCREELDRAIMSASAMVEEFGNSGAEIPRAREYLRRARELSECGRFGLGHSYAVQSVQEAKFVGDRFREAQDARAMMEQMLENARSLGIGQQELERALAAVNAAMDSREYEKAVAASASGIDMAEHDFAESARSLYDTFSKLLGSLHSLPLDRTAEEGALRKAQEHLGREEFPEAIAALRAPFEALRTKKALYDDATGSLQSAGKRLDEAEAYGIPSELIKVKLAEAMRAYSGGAYEQSAKSSGEALETAETLISERAAQAVGELREYMEENERAGTVLEDLRERVGALTGSFSSKAFGGLFKETVAIRSEIDRRKAKHAEALEGISRIQSSIEEIKAIGADVSPTEDLLGLARFAAERGAYDDVLDYSRRAETELTVAAESGLREQQARLSRRIEELAREGVELGAALKALADSSALVASRQFRAALAELRKVETDIEVRHDQFRNTQKVIAAAEARLAEAGGLGVVTAEAAKVLASAKKAAAAGVYPKAVELAEQSRDTVARNIENHQQTMGAIELARAHVREAEAMGADTARANELMEQAVAGLAARSYDEAMEKVVECETELVRSQETLVQDTAGLARATLDEAAKIGADMNTAKELLSRAESAVSARDFDQAFALARESYESAHRSRARHSAALGALSEIQKLVQNAQSEGVEAGALMQELERARFSLQRFDYDSCNETADRVRRQAELLITEASSARQELERCELLYRSANEIKADLGESERLLSRARELFRSGDYPAARENAGACSAQLSASQDRTVWNELGQVLLELEEGEDDGADLSAAAALVEEAGVALAGGDFRSALLRGRAGRAKLAEARRAFDGIHTVLLTSMLIVEEARFLDADVAAASELTVGAMDAFRTRNYHGAQELALQAAEEATRSQRGLVTQLISTAEKAVSEAESWGIRSRVARDRLARAKEAVEFQDFKGARDLLEECDDSLAVAISEHKAASERMGAMTESIVRAETLGMDLTKVRDGIARAESMVVRGEYSQALKAYSTLDAELKTAQTDFVSARTASVQAALAEARSQGMNVDGEAAALEQAASVLSSGDFTQAMELAMKASSDLERNRKEHLRVRDVISGLEAELGEASRLGVGIEEVGRNLAQAQQMLAKGSYSAAEERVRAGRLSIEAAVAESMSGRLVRLEEELRDSENRGVKAPRAIELLREATRLYRSKAYPDVVERLEAGQRELSSARLSSDEVRQALESTTRRLKETEALGAETEAAATLVGRAMEVSSEGNYAGALELLAEAGKAIEAGARVRVEEFIRSALGAIEEGDSIGADIRLARKTHSEARKALEERDFAHTAELARLALEEAERRVGEHRRHLELVTSVEKVLAEAESSSLNMDRPRRALEDARRNLRKYDYPALVSALEKIQKEAETMLRQSSEARRIISFCERKIDAARKIGAEVSSAESLLAEAKAATEKRIFVKAFELATRCLKQTDSMQHAVVLGFLTDSELHLAETEEAGADISEASDLIEVAIEALNENEFEKAMELGRQAAETARGRLAQHELAAEGLKELHRKMKDASEVGGDVSNIESLLEKGSRELSSHGYEQLSQTVNEAMDALVGSLQNLVSERTQEASAVISEVEEIGVNVAKARDRLLRSKCALECGDFKTALNMIEDSVRAAEAARRRHSETTEAIKGLQNMAREASELGLDISRAKRALAEVDEAVDDGLYDQVDRLIAESRSEMEKGYLKHAEDALARTEAALRKDREMGAQVESEEKLLSEARSIFSQGRYQLVLKSCRECQRRLDERINEHVAGIIISVENLIGEAAKIGVDARESRAVLDRSENTVSDGNYEQALRLAGEALEKTKGLLRSSVSGTISTLGGLIEESRRIGTDVREVEEFSRLATAALQKDEFETAHDHALSGIAAVDRIREEFILHRKQGVELKISDAEDMGAMVEDLRKAIARALEFLDKADFEKAALLLQETEDNTVKRQARVAEEGIRKTEEVLAKVKMDIDLTRARSLLDEARSALSGGEYEEAVDYAAQSVQEAGRVQKQFVDEVISATEEAISTAGDMGADTKKAVEILEWARADRDSGNHDAALEKAVKSSEEAEQAQYDFVRGPIEHIRRVMKEAKLTDDRIRRLVASAEGFLEKKDYTEARHEVLRAMDLTGEIQEKLAIQEITAADEVLASAEKSGARSPVARNLLRSAVAAKNARDFEKAMRYARECSVQALRTREEHSAAEKALAAAETDTAMLRELNLTPEELADLMELSRTNFASGEYQKAREYASAAREKAEKSYVKAAGEAISSSQFKINYARNIGADVAGAESILREAKAAHEAKDFRRTLELSRKCREEAELAKERYKELVDTIYSAESKISVAHTYGLDTSAAERLLSMAVAQKSRNGEEALDFARQSMEEVQRALEKFTPDIKMDIKLDGLLQKEKWSQAALTISNSGKATAKDISVRFSGDLDVQGGEKVPILRGGESRKQGVRIRPSKGGDLPLGMNVMSLREFDGKEFKSQETRWIRVEDATPLATPLNQFVTKSVRCHICLGTIKSGLPLVRCECGKTYHETCASRVGECPNCGRDLRNISQPGS